DDLLGLLVHPPAAPANAVGRLLAAHDPSVWVRSGFEGHADDGECLADWLRRRDVDRVDVVGIATDHCVRATALDAAREGFATTVLLELTAAVAPATTDVALRAMEGAGVLMHGQPVIRAA
ncbi:isochorismatase family protein, partial [Micromonospora sp. NPDC047753]|uniref:isochorismatase family protein n=1 Tax=Micromonospora sp. NPDC047753 TaxID=3154817 RepID=UPI0033F6C26B